MPVEEYREQWVLSLRNSQDHPPLVVPTVTMSPLAQSNDHIGDSSRSILRRGLFKRTDAEGWLASNECRVSSTYRTQGGIQHLTQPLHVSWSFAYLLDMGQQKIVRSHRQTPRPKCRACGVESTRAHLLSPNRRLTGKSKCFRCCAAWSVTHWIVRW